MKKNFIGILAIVIAIGSVAFTKFNEKKKANCGGMNPPSVYWFGINGTVACGSVTVSDLDILPQADGSGDTDPFDDMTTSVNDPFSCSGTGSNACARAYSSTTATDYEVIDADSGPGTDYRWRPKSATSVTCCVNKP